METQQTYNAPLDGDNIENNLSLSSLTTGYLNETSKWSKFLSILGFIAIGFMILGSLSFIAMSTVMEQLMPLPINGALFGAIYLVITLIYFFPIYYLYKFSSRMKQALVEKNNLALENAFSNLKSHYKFIGIFTIIILGFYVIALIGGLFAGAGMSGGM